MAIDPDLKPRLRPVEAFPMPDNGGVGRRIALRDPSGISNAVITVSGAALQLLAMMDGTRTCDDICDAFQAAVGQPLPRDRLESMVKQLEEARFLDSDGFAAYYQSLLDAYRTNEVRELPQTSALITDNDLNATLGGMLADENPVVLLRPVVGLIAPHLDYARGRPCYAAAYAMLQRRSTPERVVILGTNHFGRSTLVVATACHFRTPLGTTRNDRDFLHRIEQRCGNLRRYELDHAREHSIELQVAWLQHSFGAEAFAIVPFLCPDPCGPTGTAPANGDGVDLLDFAKALGDVIAADEKDTLIVAAADLSHAGAVFGDNRPLDAAYLDEIRARDKQALDNLTANDPAGWVRCVSEGNNPTRICSAGCIFALATAVRGASGTIARYHQAVDQSTQTCVTCAAVAFN
ncbi:MAG: AmmeMemoRadiSam system protein B [Phycisphaerae bacterium]